MNKAWQITVDDLSEPWYYDDIIVYAETGDKAKAIAWKENINYIRDAEFLMYTREVRYTDLRAHRVKELDKVEWEGKLVTKERFKELSWMKDRDESAKKLWKENPEATAVVMKGSDYWGHNRCGYSSTLKHAGLYSTEEAYYIVKGSDYHRQETVRLCSREEINNYIESEIEKLRNQIKELESYKR